MSRYVFRGKLSAYICNKCLVNLTKVQVKLYRHRDSQSIDKLVEASPKNTLALLTDEAVSEKQGFLLATATADENGEFSVTIDGDAAAYDGGAFEVDVCIDSIPGRIPDKKSPKLQFTITSVGPEWSQQNDMFVSTRWHYSIAARFWCHILAKYDVWVICGRLLTCEGQQPLPGALVKAFDADWLQHDALGSATTDFNGYFYIYYTSADFKKTPFSPLINIELTGGPDLFFQVEFGGDIIINESASSGRQPGRENVGHCACVELCTDKIVPPDADEIPHWERVEEFEVDTDFSTEGYAGSAANVMHDCVDLHGNMPLTNVASGKALKYRFLIGAWTWAGGTEDPAVMPSAPPADNDLVPVALICDSKVGYIYYIDGNGLASSAPVVIKSSDLDGDGCIKLLGFSVQVDMHDSTTAAQTITEANFVGAYLLMRLNSDAVTPAPYDVLDYLGLPAAGDPVASVDQAPIRRFKLRFQVYDFDAVVDKATNNKTLDALVIDNSPVKYSLNLTELTGDLCNKVTNEVHILYTIDHPHLDYFNVTIKNNGGVVHGAPPLPEGNFAGNYFFRGDESGAAGVAVDVRLDPVCAYAVTLEWKTRHYSGRGRGSERQILYCK